MEHGKVVLKLFTYRLDLLKELERLLGTQQLALVAGDSDQITDSAEKQIECMEKIQSVEVEWRKTVQELKKTLKMPESSFKDLIAAALSKSENEIFERRRAEFLKVAEKVNELKRNNTLLIHNALSLVRSTLKHLQKGQPGDVVYNPYRKPGQGHILLDKKM